MSKNVHEQLVLRGGVQLPSLPNAPRLTTDSAGNVVSAPVTTQQATSVALATILAFG